MTAIGSGWKYRKKITIDHDDIDATLSDFPVKVILDDDNFTFAHAEDDGKDVRFTSSDGETLLKYERGWHSNISGNTANVIPNGSFSLECGFPPYSSINDGSSSFVTDETAPNGNKALRIVASSTDCYTRGYTGSVHYALASASKDEVWTVSVYAKGAVGGESIGLYLFELGSDYIYDVAHGENKIATDEWARYTFTVTLTGGSTAYISARLDVNTNGGTVDFNGWQVEKASEASSYGDNNGESGIYHVKVPSISSSADTDIYLYYGNSEASDGEDAENVWDSDYELVMHMDDSLEDSTSNENDGTNHGSAMGGGSDGYYRSFDGSNDYIDLPNSITFDADYTVSCLFSTTSTQEYIQLLRKDQNLNPRQLASFQINNGNLRQQIYDDGDNSSKIGSDVVNDGELRLATFTRDGKNGKIINNGITDEAYSTMVNNAIDNTANVNLGRNPYGLDCYLDGRISEVRISSVARSDAWIKATSESLSDGLLTYGAEESLVTARKRAWAMVA